MEQQQGKNYVSGIKFGKTMLNAGGINMNGYIAFLENNCEFLARTCNTLKEMKKERDLLLKLYDNVSGNADEGMDAICDEISKFYEDSDDEEEALWEDIVAQHKTAHASLLEDDEAEVVVSFSGSRSASLLEDDEAEVVVSFSGSRSPN